MWKCENVKIGDADDDKKLEFGVVNDLSLLYFTFYILHFTFNSPTAAFKKGIVGRLAMILNS